MALRTADEAARYDFLRDLVCAVTGMESPLEAAHLRGADALFNKTESGMARKPPYIWTMPLLVEKHRLQHTMSEERFWTSHGYQFRDISRGPFAAALVLEGFRQLEDVEGARKWLRARSRGGL